MHIELDKAINLNSRIASNLLDISNYPDTISNYFYL